MNSPAPAEMPLRARIGWVCKNLEVKQGRPDPALIVGIMQREHLLEDHDPEGVKQVAAEVLEKGRWFE